MSLSTKKKDFSDRLLSHDSVSCWVAASQETYQKLLKIENSDEGVYKHGGWPANVFQAVYGRLATVAPCNNISSTADNAQSKPMVLATTNASGELVSSHVYTVHSANESYITLRNPWSVVNENDWGIPTNGGKDIHNLGDGVFEIPISTAALQCYALVYLDLPTAKSRVVRHVARSTQLRQPNALILIGLSLGVLLIVATVSAMAFRMWWRRHREEAESNSKEGTTILPSQPWRTTIQPLYGSHSQRHGRGLAT